MKKEIIKNLFKGESISLSRFINLCLYHKSFGFYQKNKIGSHFVTSPEISQIFGECISFFLLTVANESGINKFLELGPGNGTLISDIVRSIDKLSEKKYSFDLYEKSIFLSTIQMKSLEEYKSKKFSFRYLKTLKLQKEPYFFFCNEFFDALPINQIEKKNNYLYEKRIIFKNDKFKFKNFLIQNVNPNILSNGDILEYSPLTNLYLKKIFQHIKKYGGFFLIFDYGPLVKKKISTIQAIYNSTKCGIFDYPFKSDITYHVDFENIKNLSQKFDLNFYGPVSQRKFLYYFGVNERVTNLINKTTSLEIKNDLMKQFHRLTDPNGMGELFKCIFVGKEKVQLPVFD